MINVKDRKMVSVRGLNIFHDSKLFININDRNLDY